MMENIFHMYVSQELWDRAEVFGEKALGISEEIFGKESAPTLGYKSELALLNYLSGQLTLAESQQSKVVEGFSKLHAHGHDDTLNAIEALAFLFEEQEKWDDAAELRTQAWRMSEELRGKDQAETLARMADVVWLHIQTGNRDAAEELGQRVMQNKEKVLEHGDLICVEKLARFAITWELLDHKEDAKALASECFSKSFRSIASFPQWTSDCKTYLGMDQEGRKRGRNLYPQAKTAGRTGDRHWPLVRPFTTGAVGSSLEIFAGAPLINGSISDH
jgi:hypothetical protein